jgi:hypothetical protein
MKARTLSSIFLNFSILSYGYLNIHLYRAFGSELPHTFFVKLYSTLLQLESKVRGLANGKHCVWSANPLTLTHKQIVIQRGARSFSPYYEAKLKL